MASVTINQCDVCKKPVDRAAYPPIVIAAPLPIGHREVDVCGECENTTTATQIRIIAATPEVPAE